MALRTDRRTLLKGALCGWAAAQLAPVERAFSASQSGVAKLTDKIAMISGVGGNVVALAANDGLVLVDSGAAEHTEALLAQLRTLPGSARVQTLFNTHWHFDHTGGNATFARDGAKIVAHEKTKLWLATDHYIPAEDRYEKARPKEALPTQTFYQTGTATFGGERIEYGYLLEAHTDGDIYVFFRDSNVLAVGGALSPDRDPELDWFAGGWIGGRIDSLALLHKFSDDQTRIIAASGPVLSRTQLKAELDMMQTIYDRMVDLVRKGYTTKDMLQAGVLEKLGRTFSNPDKFLYDAHKGIWAHHNTLSHDVV